MQSLTFFSKRDSNAGVFMQIFWKISKNIFFEVFENDFVDISFENALFCT